MARTTPTTKQSARDAGQIVLEKPRFAPLTFSLPRKREVDPYFGCTRGYWNDLLLPNRRNNFRPLVKSLVDRSRSSERKDGKGPRGKRLVVFASALAHFNRVAAESQAQEEATDPHRGDKKAA